MKKLAFLSLLGVMLIWNACQQKKANNAEQTSTPPALADGTYCYEYHEGEDMTTIQLNIEGNDVTGEMDWLPYEKDSGRGMLKGLRNGDEITAIWTYVIEGSDQTEEVMFKIQDDHLLRKVGELTDPNNDGNLKFKDPATATYKEQFTKVDCQ